MFQPLDGPSLQDAANVTSTTVFRVKVGASEMPERSIVTILPINGLIWVFFGDGFNTPSAADVKNKGFPHPKNSLRSYEAGTSQPIFIVADTGTVNVRFAERG
jgi:hypothetical protein